MSVILIALSQISEPEGQCLISDHHNHPERVADLSLPVCVRRIAQSASSGFSLLELDLTNVIVVVLVTVVGGVDDGTTTDSWVATGFISRAELI